MATEVHNAKSHSRSISCTRIDIFRGAGNGDCPRWCWLCPVFVQCKTCAQYSRKWGLSLRTPDERGNRVSPRGCEGSTKRGLSLSGQRSVIVQCRKWGLSPVAAGPRNGVCPPGTQMSRSAFVKTFTAGQRDRNFRWSGLCVSSRAEKRDGDLAGSVIDGFLQTGTTPWCGPPSVRIQCNS